MIGGLVDVNAWLGSWPFQYFHEATAAILADRLAAEGITAAAVGNPEAAFNPDIMESNRILVRRLEKHAMLRPVPAVDPTKRDWRDVLALCRDEGAAAVRVFPGYHGYELGSPAAMAVMEQLAGERTLPLFVQVRMEDERTHHPRCRIAAVEVASVLEAAGRFPTLRFVALCPYFHEAVDLAKGPANVSFDISHVERLRTVSSLLAEVPLQRVLFGSHAPFLQPLAAVMKVQAPSAGEEARRAIGFENVAAIIRWHADGTTTR